MKQSAEPAASRSRQIQVMLIAIGLIVLAIVGWPVSGYALGFGLAYLLLGEAQKAVDQNRDPSRKALLKRLKLGSVKAGRNQARAWAIGLTAVWALQVVLNMIPAPAPETVGKDQLALTDWLEAGEALATPVHLALLAFGMLGLAIAVGALWPIGLLVAAKKGVSRLAAIAVPMAAFGFVGVGTANQHYEPTRGAIRAELVDGDNSLAKQLADARGQAVAWHWLYTDMAATKDQPQPKLSPAYFNEPMQNCASYDAQARMLYRQAGGKNPQLTFCNPALLRQALSAELLNIHGPQLTLPDTMLADFEGKLDYTWVDSDLGLRELQAMRARVVAKLNDAKSARKTLRNAAETLTTQVLGDFLPDDAHQIAEDLAKSLFRKAGRLGPERFQRLLGQSMLAKNGAVVALLDTGPAKSSFKVPADGGKQAGRKVFDTFIGADETGHIPDPGEAAKRQVERDTREHDIIAHEAPGPEPEHRAPHIVP